MNPTAPAPASNNWKLLFLVALLALAAVSAWAFVRPDVVRPQVEADVRAVLDRQRDAWNAGQLDGFLADYWMNEAATFFGENTVTQGWVAVAERYRTRYQAPGTEMGRLAFEDVVVDVLAPDAAVVRGRYRLTRAGAEADGLFTLLVRKKPDGWKIVHDHTSAKCPQKN